jgi:hypothetical protein
VSDEIRSDSQGADLSASIGFEQAIYWLSTNRDDFDVTRFRAALPPSERTEDDGFALVPPGDGEHGDFHAFFAWKITEEDIALNIDYHIGAPGPAHDDLDSVDVEGGPKSEDLMRWLGQFFNTTAVGSHAHIRYRYPSESRQSTFRFSLASELPIEADLFGVALSLPNKPDGVSSVRFTRGQSDWYAEATCEREITFATFSPSTDALSILAVLNLFLMKSHHETTA